MRRSVLPILLLLVPASCSESGMLGSPESEAAAVDPSAIIQPPPGSNVATAAAPSPGWYRNERFGYAIQVPAGFVPEAVPAMENGRVFTDDSVSSRLAVSGSTNPDGDSFSEQIDAALDGLISVEQQARTDSYYEAVAQDEDRRPVRIALARPSDNRLITATFSYPVVAEDLMGPLAARTLRSLNATPSE